MNFRFFDDVVGSALGVSQKFRFQERKHSANITQQRLLKVCGKFT